MKKQYCKSCKKETNHLCFSDGTYKCHECGKETAEKKNKSK